jgi:hypothetical protein
MIRVYSTTVESVKEKIEKFFTFLIILLLTGKNAQKDGNGTKKIRPRLLYQPGDLFEFGMFGGSEQFKQGHLNGTDISAPGSHPA